MKIEQFKQMFLAVIATGWTRYDETTGDWTHDLTAELTAKANDPKQCAKIFNCVKLVAYRNCISEHDALHSMINRGKL